jgi:DNA-binding transcriptional LysR family regulator
MNDRLAAMRLFVRVARKGSFSAAARELKLPQPTASRAIATLEREIGATLFVRTTRAVALTEAGAEYLARIEPLLAGLDEAEHAVRGTGELRGLLRVGLSSSFALRLVVPALPRFLAQHPELRVDFQIDDRPQNLVAEGVDLVVRFGELPDSTLLARKIAAWPRLLAASPAYLARRGVPKTPADLAEHDVIAGPARTALAWSFKKDGKTVSVRVDGRFRSTMTEIIVAAATAGLGIITISAEALKKELGDGTLVPVLPDWDMGTVELHALFATAATPAARAFASFLVAELA